MTSSAHFLRPQSAKGLHLDGYTTLRWPSTPGTTKSVRSDIAWNLAPLLGVTAEVTDLVHIAAGAYMADRNTPRGIRFSRDLALRVAVLAPDKWTDELLNTTAELLAWLTGDAWELSVTPASDTDLPDAILAERSAEPVCLLSGGLDSFLGAVQLLDAGAHPNFVGHKDTATSIRAAQSAVGGWLARTYSPAPSYTRIALSQAGSRHEPSSRSRALMFMSLGAAVAVSVGSTSLVIPENGYTSINLPLRPNRGGALSTRSTHPDTFRRVTEILNALSIDVTITNPYEWMTKGEAMESVVASTPPEGWDQIAKLTLSCSKLGGNWFGGSPNLNCGLCVPCMVRRATFSKANVQDPTQYLFQNISGQNLQDLLEARRGDIEAVRYAIEAGVDPNSIDAGTWPPDYDLDRAESLVQRGLNELALLSLP